MAALDTAQPDMQTFSLHGNDMKYLDIGDGPTVILIHGLLGSHHNWEPQVDMLSRRYRVIVPDLLGHGESDKPAGDYSISAHAASVRDLLHSLDISSATFVGHSLGGGIAMQTLYLFPELVERMVLIASGGLGPEVSPLLRAATLPGSELVLPLMANRTVRGLTDLAIDGLDKLGLPLMSASSTEAWRSFGSVQDAGTRRAFLATARSVISFRGQTINATPHFANFPNIQAMLIWGARDSIIPNSHTENARAELPQGRVEIFERAGHFPHLDNPDRFERVFAEFMRDCEAQTPRPRLVAKA
ncbi:MULTISPECIES: alpha/beta fold hydrolase [unclassified Rhodococcus (in: high G+C Gram-positive bacteria)]|uniref:alpha/beta fold hydrolase n=1 Tax=unclassified Rhodococcus (in: high G+C Gram-positive bacteria) TaxID=192944 RepID=UPI000A89FD19|nr:MULTISPECIES: alpha/beta fold hydrolase [unclassified Rhodococcus (in: high G+C Gram-positive bacteria)]